MCNLNQHLTTITPKNRRKEAKEDFDCSAGKKISRGLLHSPAEAVGRKDSGHRREAGPEEERGPGLVLQSAAKAEEDEVRVRRSGSGWTRIGSLRMRPLGDPGERRR